MSDGQSEPYGNGRVNGIPATLQDGDADIRGQRFLRRDHGVAGPNRLPGLDRQYGQQREE